MTQKKLETLGSAPRSFHRFSELKRLWLFCCLVILAGGTAVAQDRDPGLIPGLLMATYQDVAARIGERNDAYLAALEATDPDRAAVLAPRLEFPDSLPAINTLALADSNYGAGLVAGLFGDELAVRQANLLFCANRVAAVQILFDDTDTRGDTAAYLSMLYALGPSVPFGSHGPAFQYPLPGVAYDGGGWTLGPGAAPVVVWDMGTREALYQSVGGNGAITGQFWIASREAVAACADAEPRH